MEINNILARLFERLAGYREERPSAGTKYRLMGLSADIIEVTETLRREVLEVVSHEAVLDADAKVRKYPIPPNFDLRFGAFFSTNLPNYYEP